MLLTYIRHDCFLFSFSSCYIITDYFRAESSALEDRFPAFLRSLDPEKPVYVVVSHHHKDHFTPDIFLWEKYSDNIRFILSRDTARYARRYIRGDMSSYRGEKKLAHPERVTVLGPGDTFSDGILTVNAFGSTDIGNSYAFVCDRLSVFFAGDLNAWVWREEGSEQDDKQMMGEYRACLRHIADAFPQLDMALFPVDYRLGESYGEGALMFLKKIPTQHFIPMHFELYSNEGERELFHSKVVEFGSGLPKGLTEYSPLLLSGGSIEI